MQILGVIPARYASSRFPGKPLADIGGKPMIQRVYEQALQAKLLSKVVVATDHEAIFQAVKSFGGQVVMTREDHVSGTDRCYEAYGKTQQHFDAVINIQGDEPFIDPQQIDAVCALLENENTDISTLVRKIETTAELFNPNVVKAVCDLNGKALYFSRHPIPYQRNVLPEQWLDKVEYFKHLGIYGFKTVVLARLTAYPPALLEQAESLEQLRWLAHGHQITAAITEKEGIAVDTPEDLEKLMNKS
ncbi:MAG: 3-deoxy-manno-octulosonate cytidylyltransferase [Bacteroidales bacterium]|nr:3-deoxy-manno-octulosonate cytidylyltransferase [Bacteroidales bacterium]